MNTWQTVNLIVVTILALNGIAFTYWGNWLEKKGRKEIRDNLPPVNFVSQTISAQVSLANKMLADASTIPEAEKKFKVALWSLGAAGFLGVVLILQMSPPL